MAMDCRQLIPAVKAVISGVHEAAPDSIGDRFHITLDEDATTQSCFAFACTTAQWMRNANGTLHGGMIAALADQAMGQCAYCMMPGSGIAPSIALQVQYHRAFQPEGNIRVLVYPVSITKSVMNFRAELYRQDDTDKLCASASGVYLYKSV